MELDNLPPVRFYKSFDDVYTRAMPALRSEGRTLMSVSDYMERRVQVLELLKKGDTIKEVVNNWWENYLASSTGIARCGNEIKIVESPECLLNINESSKLKYGFLVLTKKQYDDLNGKTISLEGLEKACFVYMPKEKVLEHPVWQAVASKELLKKYADAGFNISSHEIIMEVCIPSASKVPILTAISLGARDVGLSLDGSNELSDEAGYLVGKLDDRFAKEARDRGFSQEVALDMAKAFPHAQIIKSEDDDD